MHGIPHPPASPSWHQPGEADPFDTQTAAEGREVGQMFHVEARDGGN